MRFVVFQIAKSTARRARRAAQCGHPQGGGTSPRLLVRVGLLQGTQVGAQGSPPRREHVRTHIARFARTQACCIVTALGLERAIALRSAWRSAVSPRARRSSDRGHTKFCTNCFNTCCFKIKSKVRYLHQDNTDSGCKLQRGWDWYV